MFIVFNFTDQVLLDGFTLSGFQLLHLQQPLFPIELVSFPATDKKENLEVSKLQA